MRVVGQLAFAVVPVGQSSGLILCSTILGLAFGRTADDTKIHNDTKMIMIQTCYITDMDKF